MAHAAAPLFSMPRKSAVLRTVTHRLPSARNALFCTTDPVSPGPFELPDSEPEYHQRATDVVRESDVGSARIPAGQSGQRPLYGTP